MALLLFVFLAGFLTLPKLSYIGDPYSWREEARNLVLHGKPIVQIHEANYGEPGQYFVQNPRTQNWHSKYGIMNTFVNALPLAVEKGITGELPALDSEHRQFILHCFFLLISLGVAALLYKIALHFTNRCWLAFAFVVICIYPTYLWHYLRATNTESTQLLFFLAFFEQWVRYRKSNFQETKNLAWAWVWFFALVLTKFSYLLMLAPIGVALYFSEKRGKLFPWRNLLFRYAIPAGLIFLTLGFVNWLRFGHPLLSGYHAWNPGETSFSVSYRAFFYDFLLNPQWSILSHFPPLLFALFGWREFFRRFRWDAFFLLATFILFALVIGKMPLWRGEWGYGPRYFLFIMPLLSLPLILAFERWWLYRRALAAFLTLPMILLLGYSTFLQFHVARADPFLFYWVRPAYSCIPNSPVEKYFNTTHFGQIYREFYRHKAHPDEIWFAEYIEDHCTVEEHDRFLENLENHLAKKNLYWWK